MDENYAFDWTTDEEKLAYSRVKAIVARMTNETLAKESRSK